MPNVNDLRKYLTHSDVYDGDEIEFVDEGEFIEKDFSKKKDGSDMKTILEITVELPDGKHKLYSPNTRTRTALTEGYGTPDTKKWVGRKASVVLVKQECFGDLRTVIYLEPIK